MIGLHKQETFIQNNLLIGEHFFENTSFLNLNFFYSPATIALKMGFHILIFQVEKHEKAGKTVEK